MHFVLFLIVSAVLGALGRRIAGGVLNQWFVTFRWRPGRILTLLGANPDRVMGDTPARLLYGLSMALAAAMGGSPLLLAAFMVPAFWIGSTTGNFNSIAMGRDYPSRPGYWGCVWGMTAHAALTALTPVLMVMLIGGLITPLPWQWAQIDHFRWWLLASYTMLAAPLYSIAWDISGFEGRPHWPIGLQGGAEIGEALWGAQPRLVYF